MATSHEENCACFECDILHNRLINEKKAAARLGLCVSTLQHRRLRGEPPRFSKLGRSVRYYARAVDDFARSRERNSTSDRRDRNESWTCAPTMLAAERAAPLDLERLGRHSAHSVGDIDQVLNSAAVDKASLQPSARPRSRAGRPRKFADDIIHDELASIAHDPAQAPGSFEKLCDMTLCRLQAKPGLANMEWPSVSTLRKKFGREFADAILKARS